jgi:hypothetical protein
MVGSMRPKSGGKPLYLSKSGTSLLMARVSVGNLMGAPARMAPFTGFTLAPSAVTSFEHMPL